jgi:hypothetical protein
MGGHGYGERGDVSRLGVDAMRDNRNGLAKSRIVSKLHAEGRHIDAEWERLKTTGARKDATAEDLASHRLSFFLGAIAVLQAIQDAEDVAVVDEVQAELEAFLAEMEATGHLVVTSATLH